MDFVNLEDGMSELQKLLLELCIRNQETEQLITKLQGQLKKNKELEEFIEAFYYKFKD